MLDPYKANEQILGWSFFRVCCRGLWWGALAWFLIHFAFPFTIELVKVIKS